MSAFPFEPPREISGEQHRARLPELRFALDEETEIGPAIRKLVEEEFARGGKLPLIPFPEDGSAVHDTPRLMLVLLGPEAEWQSDGKISRQIANWNRERGASPRLYPA